MYGATDPLIHKDSNSIGGTQSKSDLQGKKPPRDECAAAYILFVVMGSGLLLPWNAIIQAIDFFLVVFPGSMIETQLAVAYMSSSMAATIGVLIFNKYVRVRNRWKLILGFALMLLAIVVFTIMGKSIKIWICIAMTVVAGIGDGLAQMALYGMSGVLPPRFTGAVMIGNAISGIIVSLLKVATKVSFEDDEAGLLNASRVFFGISTFFCLLCIAAVLFVDCLPVVRYYKRLHRESERRPDDSANEDMHEVPTSQNTSKHNDYDPKSFSYCSILSAMRHPALCVMGNFAFTMSVYPGLTLAIPSSAGLKGGWFPVTLVGVFNCMDFLGRWILRWEILLWKKPQFLWIPTLVRVLVLFPLILLCAMRVIQSDTVAYIVVAVLAFSNGYIASNSMMLGPQQVSAGQQEHAGSMMAWLLLTGLTVGAVIGEIYPPVLEQFHIIQ